MKGWKSPNGSRLAEAYSLWETRSRSAKNVAVLRILSPKRLKIQSADIFTGPPPENDTLSGWDGTGVNFWDVLEKLLVGVSVY